VLIPNQVVALFVGVAVAFIVEPLLGFGITFWDAVADAARFFPSQATMSTLNVFGGADAATTQALGGAENPLAWWVGALVLLTYAAGMTTLGWLLTARRDVAGRAVRPGRPARHPERLRAGERARLYVSRALFRTRVAPPDVRRGA